MSILKSHLEGINLNQQNNQGNMSGNLSNCYPGGSWGGSGYTFGGLQQQYMYTATIRKVSNGYVLTVGSAEYVFESAESMVSKLKEVLEPKNGA